MVNAGYVVLFSFIFMIMGYLMGSILFGAILSKVFHLDIKSKGSGNLGSTNVLRTCGPIAGLITFIWDSMKGWLAVFFSSLILVNAVDLVGDISKVGYIIYLGGFFAIIGHCYPLHFLYFLFKFKFDVNRANEYHGGKGAATSAGVCLAISPWIYLICFATFWIVLFITKYVSLSSMISIGLGFILMLIPSLDYFYMLNILGNDNCILKIGSVSHEFMNPTINFKEHWDYLFFCFVFMFFMWALVVYKHKDNILRLLNRSENKMFQKKHKTKEEESKPNGKENPENKDNDTNV